MYYDPRQEPNCQHMTKNQSLDTLSLWGKSFDSRKEMLLLRLSANEDCCMSSYPVLPRKTGALSRSSGGYINRGCIQYSVQNTSTPEYGHSIRMLAAVIHGETYHVSIP